MGYVGNQQAEGFVQRPTKQDLTGATGTSLTLSHAVSKEEDIDLYINNVKQEPATAYTVAGTAVTLTGSVVATDDIYVVYNSLALQTVVPPDGSVTTAKLASGAVTSAKLDTNIDIAGTLDVTGTLTADGNVVVSGYVKPTLISFSAYLSASISSFITNSDFGLPVPFDSTDYNDGSAFTTSGTDIGLFVAPVAGIYSFDGWVYSSSNSNITQIWLTKNGARMDRSDIVSNAQGSFIGGTWNVKLASGDKVGIHPYNATTLQIQSNANHTFFRGNLVTAQ